MTKLCIGSAPRIFDGEILVFHFDAYFELLVRQQNWHSGALGESPFAAAIAGIFLFEKPIHRPLDVFTEVLRQQETKLICIWYFGRTTFFLFFSRRRWRAFFMANGADAKLVLSEQSWVQRNLVPISEGVTAFEADRLKPAATIEPLQFCFGRETKPVRQTHLYFLGEEMVGEIVTEGVALIDCPKIKCPRREDISTGGRRETRTREPARSAISAGDIVPGDDDTFYILSFGRVVPAK